MDRPHSELIQPTSTMLTYDRYLKIPELLALQVPVSEPEQHDETLFIVIHQVYELWFKQILHEIDNCAKALGQDQLLPFLRSLKRINTIQQILTSQVGVLETMTPSDFNLFRERLNPASGFQSHQFRIVEFKLGAKDQGYLKFFRTQPNEHALIERALAEPTVYDHFLHHLARRGIAVPKEVLERDVSKPHVVNDQLTDLLHDFYLNPDRNYDIYLTLEALIDIDEHFMLWRYRHVAMVERMIGSRRGTGGSTGVDYLAQTLSKRFFPEIWQLRNKFAGQGYGAKRP